MSMLYIKLNKSVTFAFEKGMKKKEKQTRKQVVK